MEKAATSFCDFSQKKAISRFNVGIINPTPTTVVLFSQWQNNKMQAHVHLAILAAKNKRRYCTNHSLCFLAPNNLMAKNRVSVE